VRGQINPSPDTHDDSPHQTEQAFSAFGVELSADDPDAPDVAPSEVFYLWPENVEPWSLWHGVQTQWRIGISGATGLDYQGVSAYLDRLGLEPQEHREMFDLLQACERATLDVWAEQRAKHHPR
jgi:hypothetical protein